MSLHRVTDNGQPWEIVKALNEQGALTHGGQGTATIKRASIPELPGRLTPAEIVARTFFCPSTTTVETVAAYGDGQPINENTPVEIDGMEHVLPQNWPAQPGHYDIGPVNVLSNGSLRVSLTRETIFTPSNLEPLAVP